MYGAVQGTGDGVGGAHTPPQQQEGPPQAPGPTHNSTGTTTSALQSAKQILASIPPFFEGYVSDFRKKISKEEYLRVVAVFGSLVGAVYGFVVTLSGLLLMDSTFVERMGGDTTTSSFELHFIVLFYLGEVVGALLSFLLSDIFGRKTTIVYASAACVLLLLWMCLSADGTDLLTSRFFLGWGLGLIMAVAPVYTSEVAIAADRGKTVGMLSLTGSAGSLTACVLYFALQGYSFGWRVALVVPIVVLLVKIVGLLFLPESPRWILAHRTPTECLESMRQLRRTNDVSKEFHDIYQALSSDARLGESWIEILSSKTIRYRLVTACVLQFSHQLLGIEIITTFGSYLLGLLDMHSILLGLLLAYVSGLLGTILGLSKVDSWGRRFLLICGCLSICCSWLGACVCVYVGGLEDGKAELYFQSYVLRFLFGSFLCLFAFSFAFGVESVSWVVAAELFPLRARGRASSLTTACHGASAVIVSSVLADWIDEDGTSTTTVTTAILLFATYALFLALFVFLALPETRGMMLEEMEELFDVGISSAGGCGCCPEWKTGLMGLRTISSTGATGNSSQKDNDTTLVVGNNIEPFEPSTLHKYSGGMRETQFQYFHEGGGREEEAPLVPSFVSGITRVSGGPGGGGGLGGGGGGGGTVAGD